MTDRDDLEALLADTPPPKPDPSRRTRDLAAAMTAFDAQAQADTQSAAQAAPEKISDSFQGSADRPRPTVRQHRLSRLWRRMMTLQFELPSTRMMMMGTASVAVMVLAIGAFQTQIGDSLDGSEGFGFGQVSGLSSKNSAPVILQADEEVAGTPSTSVQRESVMD